MANIISNYWDLKGPSYVIDTACSSGLSALDVGYHYITSGKCEDAIIATANLCLHSATNLHFFRLGIFIKFLLKFISLVIS